LVKSTPMQSPASFRFSGEGEFTIDHIALGRGESFSLTGKEFNDERFMNRFNYAFEIGTLVRV